ncbi:Fe(2+) transporter permease subunit FeoB [Chitinilyticum piscinae]|uniref:Ferrous iron transport protein B n=1 Tax=Chitinilyticum piscinae TaxID=2866724 RepID=A0A8J7K0S6_9NEIS|nr:Fe(2+) transporter permease subunit FeoB [Chitinilyticum piscinae]MBE9608351.1 Fe(2+) transporter permease subunit FeoB [Chitinilyticum piscinae]
MSGFTIALLGNPNCGKTTLFNALTGSRQQVGNWPGVTVERKSGFLREGTLQVEVVDLPGVYSLNAAPDSSADEQVTRDYILSGSAKFIVNIVDASNLERNLYLTTQLLELGVPCLVVLNMVDVAERQGVSIDAGLLAEQLGCPVLAISASKKRGLDQLKKAIFAQQASAPGLQLDLPEKVGYAVAAIADALSGVHTAQSLSKDWLALKLLEGDHLAESLCPAHKHLVADHQAALLAEYDLDADILIADARYRFANRLCAAVRRDHGLVSRHVTEKIDRVVLNRWLGLPVFLLIMYLMFLATIHVGSAFIDVFDQSFAALLVDEVGALLTAWHAPQWLVVLLANGMGGGIQTIATFIPVVGCLYLILSALEDSGYMARAAFVMDRAMRALGLPGKSFVPLLIGFGCNVPAIMATRTLETRRDRILTAMMAPFMSCGARLPVYALFAAAFFPHNGQTIVFALYLIGIAFAVLTAYLLRRSLLPGDGAPLVMELPLYHRPTLGTVLRRSWDRLRDFVINAGRVIVPMVMVLSMLNAIGTDGSFGHENSEKSVLASVGKAVVPVFEPLGLDENNWQAAVGLVTGVLAKEAVVGTLNALYSQSAGAAAEAPKTLTEKLADALATVPANLGAIVDKLADPLGMSIGDVSNADEAAKTLDASTGTFGAMQQHFHGASGAFAFLLLILLYTPCMAALGAMKTELGTGWAAFAAGWTLFVGYSAATVFYQLSHWSAQALMVLAVLVAAWIVLLMTGRYLGRQPQWQEV